MRTKTMISVIVGAATVGLLALNASSGIAQDTAPAGSYAEVNGLNLYYEIHGTGEPLVVLHGGLGSTDMFAALMPVLSQNRQVIAVDL